jgi:hypothetical protein
VSSSRRQTLQWPLTSLNGSKRVAVRLVDCIYIYRGVFDQGWWDLAGWGGCARRDSA